MLVNGRMVNGTGKGPITQNPIEAYTSENLRATRFVAKAFLQKVVGISM